MGKYYVIQVYTGAEQKTIDAIKGNISKDIIEDCFFVIKRRKKKFLKTWHVVEENCFPGYIFIESDKPSEMCKSLSSLHIFARILGLDKDTFYVQSISEQEKIFIDTITNRHADSRIIDISQISIQEGQIVEIVSGPLKGFEGKVSKFDLHRRKAIVEVKILNTIVRTDLGIEILKTDVEPKSVEL